MQKNSVTFIFVITKEEEDEEEEEEEEETDAATTYASLLLRQQGMMKESSIFVFDLSKELNICPMDTFSALLYVTGFLPVIPGSLINCDGYGHLSFKPRQLERDDHLIIVKLPHKWSRTDVDKMVDVLLQNLPEDELLKIGQMLQKFISTKKELTRDQKTFVNSISNLDLSNKLNHDTKHKILSCWFSNVMVGPFCITRTLDYIEFNNNNNNALSDDDISCEIINKLKNCLEDSTFWKFKMDYMIIMDKNYFTISGRENELMKYPLQIQCNYVALKDIVPIHHRQKETIKVRSNKKYIYIDTQDDDIDSKSDCNSYQTLIIENEQGKLRLELDYGVGVFCGMMTRLMEVVNGQRFDDWCTHAHDVKWEIWFGRDEQNKLKDIRKMKQENVKLQKEIERLQQALRDHNNNNNNSNNNDDERRS